MVSLVMKHPNDRLEIISTIVYITRSPQVGGWPLSRIRHVSS